MGRLLVIDDDDQVRTTLAEVVESLGHRVRTAADGRIGLEIYEQEPFDCIITDLAMPEVDGLTVLRRVKKKTPQVGVLVITGNSTVDLLASAVNLGADAYVTKPFKISELDEQVTRILAKRAAQGATAGAGGVGGALGARVPLAWALLGGTLLLVVSHLLFR